MRKSGNIYRIAIMGPESTGKTSIAQMLAQHYATVFSPEYSRTYMENLDRKYTVEDVFHCIREQAKEEEKLLTMANRFLFADTEHIMGKVWLEDVFKSSPAWVEELIRQKPYDLYLLTRPDLPFVPDPVRENPGRRDFFYEWYERELKERNAEYTILSGKNEERIQNAIKVIDERFNT